MATPPIESNRGQGTGISPDLKVSGDILLTFDSLRNPALVTVAIGHKAPLYGSFADHRRTQGTSERDPETEGIAAVKYLL
jgi:hypothetical protein